MDTTTCLPTPHPTEDTLENYALGRLSEPQLGRVESHLFLCHDCQDALAETDEYLAVMKAALAEPLVTPLPETVTVPRRWAAFASRFMDSLRFPRPAFSAALAALALALVLSQTYTPGITPQEATITLRSVRGGGVTTEATGPAGKPLNFKIQSPYLRADKTFQAQIVDAAGEPIWTGAPRFSQDQGFVLQVGSQLQSGTYWVRLYDQRQKLLQEYGLRLE